MNLHQNYLKALPLYFLGKTRGDSIDLAVLVLEHKIKDQLSPVTEVNYVQIVSLPDPDVPCPKGKYLVASGWGKDKYNTARKTTQLWTVFQECVPNEKCNIISSTSSPPVPYYLCASDTAQPLNSVCSGDSGGISLLCISIHHLVHYFHLNSFQ